MEAEARAWLGQMLGEALPDGMSTHAALKDGVRLCALACAVQPGVCKPPSPSALPFKQMENIAAYLQACPSFGVAAFDMFQTVDLFEGKGMRAVLSNLLALKRVGRPGCAIRAGCKYHARGGTAGCAIRAGSAVARRCERGRGRGHADCR